MIENHMVMIKTIFFLQGVPEKNSFLVKFLVKNDILEKKKIKKTAVMVSTDNINVNKEKKSKIFFHDFFHFFPRVPPLDE